MKPNEWSDTVFIISRTRELEEGGQVSEDYHENPNGDVWWDEDIMGCKYFQTEKAAQNVVDNLETEENVSEIEIFQMRYKFEWEITK